MMRRRSLVLSCLLLSACTAPQPQPMSAPPEASAHAAVPGPRLWAFAEEVNGLRAKSCPDEVKFTRPQAMPIRVIEAERASAAALKRQLRGLTLAGAWQLESEEPNFGGLSGLEVMPSGSLLSVSDGGAFIWIGIDPDTGTPDGIGAISYMRADDGNYFSGKLAADAEGLAFREGVALVSFERDHRIEAFDLEGCGAAARGVRVFDLPAIVADKLVPANRGAEALALRGEHPVAGFEFSRARGSPVGRVLRDGSLDKLDFAGKNDRYLLTGLDIEGGLSASLFRAYDPLRGARVRLEVQDSEGQRARADVKRPLPTDNFEGVAIGRAPDGRTRVWVISDNNFSMDQRTLLLAFDLD